jgi:hypothetical protein
MKTVSVAQAAIAQEAVLPARVQEALGSSSVPRRKGCSHSASVSAWVCWPS